MCSIVDSVFNVSGMSMEELAIIPSHDPPTFFVAVSYQFQQRRM